MAAAARRPFPVAPLAAAVWLVASGCGGSNGEAGEAGGLPEGPGAGEAARTPPGVIRLWRHAATAEAFGPLEARRHRLTADQAFAETWYRLRSDGDAHVALEPFVPDGPGVELRPGRELGLALPIDARPGEALAVRVTARVPASAPPGTVLAGSLVELPGPLRPEDGLTQVELEAILGLGHQGTHRIWAGVDDGVAMLSGDLLVGHPASGLLLLLMAPLASGAGLDPFVVDAVQVWQRSVPGHLAAGHDVPQVDRSTVGDWVHAMLDRDRRPGLLALPGRRHRFTLPDDARPRRLDLALGLDSRPPTLEGALRARVLADGAPVFEERLVALEPDEVGAWREVRVELPAGCRELALEAVGEGPDPPIVVWGHPTVRARADDPRPNVVLVSLDTLRPDRLGCYGFEPSHSPRIDALAAQGMLCANAYSTSSYTLPSHASMLSGQHPSRHGLVDRPGRLQRGRSPALAELLADAGFVTAAFTGGGFVGSAFGLDRGFDRFSHNDPVWALGTVRGEQLIEVDGVPDARRRALLERYASPMIAEWIAEQDDGAPFFLFLHTYVVHNYAPDRRRIEQHRLLDPFGNERRLVKDDLNRFNNGERFLRRGVIDQYVPYYDATIAMADDFVGEVLDALAGAGLDGDTLVIVTSDHGEEFGEHGYFGHGQTLFDTNARVPLIVRLPAGAPDAGPAVHDGLVSLVDLAPWILRLVGLAPDPRMAVGPPLGPEQEAPPARSRVFLDLDTRFHRVQAVREGDWKLHVRHAGDAFGEHTALVRLYDLDADPAERRDLGGGSETGRTLRELLDEFTRHAEALGAQGAAEDEAVDPLDDDVLESLRQLGYVDTHGPDAPAGDR